MTSKNDKDFAASGGGMIEREMMRCRTCRAWWSWLPGESKQCPCGGDLEGVDMAAHVAAVPEAKKGDVR